MKADIFLVCNVLEMESGVQCCPHLKCLLGDSGFEH
jgi:hypothetical protein